VFLNEAPRSELQGTLSGIPPKPYPPSLLRASAGRLAIPLCSKPQSTLAKANGVVLRLRREEKGGEGHTVRLLDEGI
jgi:hypothetical protein